MNSCGPGPRLHMTWLRNFTRLCPKRMKYLLIFFCSIHGFKILGEERENHCKVPTWSGPPCSVNRYAQVHVNIYIYPVAQRAIPATMPGVEGKEFFFPEPRLTGPNHHVLPRTPFSASWRHVPPCTVPSDSLMGGGDNHQPLWGVRRTITGKHKIFWMWEKKQFWTERKNCLMAEWTMGKNFFDGYRPVTPFPHRNAIYRPVPPPSETWMEGVISTNPYGAWEKPLLAKKIFFWKERENFDCKMNDKKKLKGKKKIWWGTRGKLCPYRSFAPPCVGRQHYNHLAPPCLEKNDPMQLVASSCWKSETLQHFSLSCAGKVQAYSNVGSHLLEKCNPTALAAVLYWKSSTLQGPKLAARVRFSALWEYFLHPGRNRSKRLLFNVL